MSIALTFIRNINIPLKNYLYWDGGRREHSQCANFNCCGKNFPRFVLSRQNLNLHWQFSPLLLLHLPCCCWMFFTSPPHAQRKSSDRSCLRENELFIVRLCVWEEKLCFVCQKNERLTHDDSALGCWQFRLATLFTVAMRKWRENNEGKSQPCDSTIHSHFMHVLWKCLSLLPSLV